MRCILDKIYLQIHYDSKYIHIRDIHWCTRASHPSVLLPTRSSRRESFGSPLMECPLPIDPPWWRPVLRLSGLCHLVLQSSIQLYQSILLWMYASSSLFKHTLSNLIFVKHRQSQGSSMSSPICSQSHNISFFLKYSLNLSLDLMNDLN